MSQPWCLADRSCDSTACSARCTAQVPPQGPETAQSTRRHRHVRESTMRCNTCPVPERNRDARQPPFRRPVIGGEILAVGPAGVPPVPLPPPRQVHCCHPCSLWWVAVTHPLRRRPPRPLWKLPPDSPPRIASSMHIAPCPPPTAHKKTHAAPVQDP